MPLHWSDNLSQFGHLVVTALLIRFLCKRKLSGNAPTFSFGTDFDEGKSGCRLRLK